MATREDYDAIIEDADDEWDRHREAVEAVEPQLPGGQRAVVEQRTRVRMVYQHTLVLECGHTEHRTGSRTGAAIRRAKCSSCAPTQTVVEEAKPRGWLERFITGRRDQ